MILGAISISVESHQQAHDGMRNLRQRSAEVEDDCPSHAIHIPPRSWQKHSMIICVILHTSTFVVDKSGGRVFETCHMPLHQRSAKAKGDSNPSTAIISIIMPVMPHASTPTVGMAEAGQDPVQ